VHIDGDRAEEIVWQQIEELIRNPTAAVKALQKKAEQSRSTNQPRIEKLEAELRAKRDAKVRLVKQAAEYGFDSVTLKQAKGELDREEQAILVSIEELKAADEQQTNLRAALATVPKMLTALRELLDGPLPFEVRRKVLEILVDTIKVETMEVPGGKRANLHIRFRFFDNCAPC